MTGALWRSWRAICLPVRAQTWRTSWEQRLWPGAVLALAFVVRMYVLLHHRLSLTLHSDDTGYTQSAIWLLQYGRFAYYDPAEPTVHMMPGITLLLAAVFAVLGWGPLGVMAAKAVMVCFGCLACLAAYGIGREIAGPLAGLAGGVLAALYVPGVLTDTLLLTEPPFSAFALGLVYWTLRWARTHRHRDAAAATGCYIGALLFRPTIALYPLVMGVYLLARRCPWRLLLRQGAAAALAVALVLSPWWVRNYETFHRFIPLTNGSGDPLLLGTFQGEGYPPGSYQEIVALLKLENPGIQPDELMQLEQQVAEQRMQAWWTQDKASMLRSYAWLKPQLLWLRPFYWRQILTVHIQQMWDWQPRLVDTSLVGWGLGLLLARGRRREIAFALG
ncbi:MAG: glycosyltransferase family 39 protein, partial [Alicyclobacillus sp.]|nr:glycosyltransferase family 39 protein [Alicyclobacillus sp.]